MKKLAIILLAALLLSFAACSFGKNDTPVPTGDPANTQLPTAEPTDEPTDEPTEEPTPDPTPAPGEFVFPDDITDYAFECIGNADSHMTEAVEFIRQHPISVPGETHPFVPPNEFEKLSGDALSAYNAMLEAAGAFSELTVDSCSSDDMEAALNALYTDHPEIETYFSMIESEDGYCSLYSMPSGRYVEPAEDMDALKDQVAALELTARYIASLIPEEFSPIDKYRTLAYYICLNTQYAHVEGEIPRYATTPFGAVINGYSICQGYALGFEYLCRAADLDCRRLTNGRTDDNMHFWDIVTLDQGTYFVDVTWSDTGSPWYQDNLFFDWFIFPADRHHVAADGTTTTGKAFNKLDWYVSDE